MRTFVLLAVLLSVVALAWGQTPAKLRVLYLTKSSGFEHSVVKREGDQPAYSERIMSEIVRKMGGTLTITKDASQINAENLRNLDVVIFYTSGDLTDPGTDQQPVIGPNGVSDLLAWIEGGGGFIGFHSANDSFHSPEGSVSSYIEMLGGEFKTHGPQFEGILRVVSPDHPAIAHLPDGWSLQDEWYLFVNLNKEKMHILALLDPGEAGRKIDLYNIPSYPIIWCRTYGKGRTLYNALGHREDVWDSSIFQQVVADNIKWARGGGAAAADPNYALVAPAEIEPSAEKKP